MTTMPKRISILGATGSVGTSALDLVQRNPDRFVVEALTANDHWEELAALARAFRPACVAIGETRHALHLSEALAGTGVTVLAGETGIVEAASRAADLILAAIVGSAGLRPTLAAAAQGSTVALANKECLVCAGALMMAVVRQAGTTLLPVDSEHNAIFQVLDSTRPESVHRLILTASGGPFRTWTAEAMALATPAQAVAHPNWSMGSKISVDSATMMNKGLELIEAHHLFAMPEERIDIVVHPQSVVHSMVEYRDGSVLAQMGVPDMRTPIAHVLAWPARMDSPVPRLNLAEALTLTFEPPDADRFPALSLARHSLRQGGAAPTLLNAANEEAVAAFLVGKLDFPGISAVVAATLEALDPAKPETVDHVMALDAQARRFARDAVTARMAA